MEPKKYKTSIKCSGCVEAVKPHLDNIEDIEKWEVDLQSAEKTLYVYARSKVSDQKVMEALKSAGYMAEPQN